MPSMRTEIANFRYNLINLSKLHGNEFGMPRSHGLPVPVTFGLRIWG